MAKKKTSDPLPPPDLVIPRSEARQMIGERLKIGGEIRDSEIGAQSELDEARSQFSRWSEYNKEMLTRIFDNLSIAEEYDRARRGVFSIGESYLAEEIRDFREDVTYKTDKLASLLDRIDLIPAPDMRPAPEPNGTEQSPPSGDVFVVHGHDDKAKLEVCRFLEKLGLNPIVLHEKPNLGRTLIEKFEDHAAVSFAVVIMTPDDLGRPMSEPAGDSETLKPRARQNVILELGYFLGKLGRRRVCPLYSDDVEIPSDYDGVVYVPLDPNGGWKLKLASELKHAKVPVDMDKAI